MVSQFRLLICSSIALTVCSFSMAETQAGNVTEAKRIVETAISDAPAYAKYALVIGVTDYDACAPLPACANDAKKFANLLKSKYGFENVVLMTDDPGGEPRLRPTQRHIQKALDTMYNGIVPGKSEVIFYYSGHGTRAKDVAGDDTDWLVPEDADPAHVTSTCISYDQIRAKIGTIQPSRVLMITDACRDLLGNKGVATSGFGKGLHLGLIGPEVAELESCQPTETSLVGMPKDFDESVFSHYLIQGLAGDPDAIDPDKKAVTFDSLKQYVQYSVHAYAAKLNAVQTPDGRATLGGMILARFQPGQVTRTDSNAAIVNPVIVPAPTANTKMYARAIGADALGFVGLTFDTRFALMKGKGSLGTWDTSTGHLQRAMQIDQEVIKKDGGDNIAAISPDGKFVAYATSNVFLFDAISGTQLSVLTGHQGRVDSLTFSPDGKILASGGDDRKIRLWDTSSGTLLRTLTGSGGHVNTIAFTSDGKTLVSGSQERIVTFWNVADGQISSQIKGSTGAVYKVIVSNSGTVAALTGSAIIKVWDVQTGAVLHTLDAHNGDNYICDWSPDGHVLIACTFDGNVNTWDVDSGTLVSTVKCNDYYVSGLAFTPDGDYLAVKYGDSALTFKPTATLQSSGFLAKYRTN